MDYRCLGRTGLHVSPICMGTMNFGSPVDEAGCMRLVSHALDQGLNFFDTANAYEGYARTFGSAGGVGERLLGKALGKRRDEAVILTKLGNPIGQGPLHAGLSNHHLSRELDQSLLRLGTDHVDVLLCHRADPTVAIEDVWHALDRFVREGKVRAAGISNWPSWRMTQACELAARHGLARCAVSSPQYSLLNRDIELEHMPACAHYEVGLVTYKGLMGGVLTGKYRRGQTDLAGTRAGDGSCWLPPLTDDLFDRIEAYERIVDRSGCSMTDYSIAWLLSRPMVASLVLGFRNADQIDAALAAAGRTVPDEDANEIDRIFEPPIRPGGEQVMRWRGGWVLDAREM
jgi:aryl-alcohol dehydrogenase-like predicted oxidoreductase